MSVNQNASVIDGRGAANRPGGKTSRGGGFKPIGDEAAVRAMLTATNELACGLTDKLTASTAARLKDSAELLPMIREGVDYATGRAISQELENDARIVGGASTMLAKSAALGQFERVVQPAAGDADKRRAAVRKFSQDQSANYGGKDQRRQREQAMKAPRLAALCEALCIGFEDADAVSYIGRRLLAWSGFDADSGSFWCAVPERHADFTIMRSPSGKGKLYRSLTGQDIANVKAAIKAARGPAGICEKTFTEQLRSYGYVAPLKIKADIVSMSDDDADAALVASLAAPSSLESLAASFAALLAASAVTAGESLEFLQRVTLAYRQSFAASLAADQPSIADDVIADVIDDAAALAE